MKRILDLRGTRLIAIVLLAAVLSGCDLQGDSSTTFLDFVQTVLLGVTAAGAVAIIKNV